MSELLEVIEVETGPNPTWAVIWMHGLGADGHDFAGIVPELKLDGSGPVRFVFPHAPAIPVTCNNGYVMRAWYDILELGSLSRHVDEDGLKESREAIRRLIARENARGIPCERIVLAGFSQGGAMAYTTGLTHGEKLAGIIALSTYFPSLGLIEAESTAANALTPVFAAHGSMDPVVPAALGADAAKRVSTPGRQVDWHTWAMPHTVVLEEIALIGKWLRERIAAAN
ncbi:MAG: alpha/beta hydrolase [Burkholderiales bacterium]|nr:alpha/beta hydrolase [Burkholderiales bacterium]